MREKVIYLVVFFSLLQFACERPQKQQSILDSNPPKVVAANGYAVPLNSMAPAKVALSNVIKGVAVSKPKVVKLISNVYPVRNPRVIQTGTPGICIPGENGFSLPRVVAAKDSPFIAGLPEVVMAKEPQIMDNNPASFSSFTTAQGLKSNNTVPMIQDKAGNLWIGSWGGGVSKYDGRSFTNYNTSQGLSNDVVWSILEDSKGNLWFGTIGGGVNKFDGKSFSHFTTNQGLSDNNVWSILEDKNGIFWFGTGRGGVNRFDGKSFTHFTTDQGLSNNSVNCIFEDRNGILWFGTGGGGVSKYDGRSFINYTTKEGLSNDIVWNMLEDRSATFMDFR